MKKIIKRIIIIVVIVAVACGGVFAGVRFYRSKTQVEVMSVDMIATEYSDESSYSGLVANDESQLVYVDDTEKIGAVHVKVGDRVTKGQVLLSYKSTEDADSIEEIAGELAVAQNDLAIAESQLARLREKANQKDKTEEIDYSIPTGPKKTQDAYNYLKKGTKASSGSGASNDPYIYLVTNDCYATSDFMNNIREKKYYVCFETREDNKADGELLERKYVRGVTLEKMQDKYFYTIATGEVYDPNAAVEPDEDIRTSIREKQSEIVKLQNDIRSYQLRISQAKNGGNTDVIKATMDGVVLKAGRDENDEEDDVGTAYIIVSNSSDLYIKGAISELRLGTIQVGSTITATDWVTGTNVTATITDIGNYPTTDSNYDIVSYGTAESYYEYKAKIDNPEGINNGDNVEVSFNQTGSSDSIYIEKSFVRSMNNKNYVFVMDENDRLEKREVSVGGTIYGSYIEIKKGLTTSDYIAFPYGKTARDGVKCKVVDYIGDGLG